MRAILLVLAAALAGCVPRVETGRADYARYCAGCHGADGSGGTAPGLTGLAARNGGRFPAREVVSTVDGFGRRVHGETVMPEFGPLLEEGTLVPWDSGDGRRVATPERLVALAVYLESVQR